MGKWTLAFKYIPSLLKLTQYDLVVLLDNTGSMFTERLELGNDSLSMQALRLTLIRFSEIAKELSGFEIPMEFIEGDYVGTYISQKNVDGNLAAVGFPGYARLGTMLKKRVVGPILLNRNRKRPIISIVIVNHEPLQEATNTLQRTILEYKESRGADTRSRFLILQIGNDSSVTKLLTQVRSDVRIGDIVLCPNETLDEMYKSAEWPSETDTGPGRLFTGRLLKLLATLVDHDLEGVGNLPIQ
ncbi:hypothetical protein BJX64DRAFT_133400 [Aspergillus heterothallicus]